MRKVDPELQARLDAGATRMCRCWQVVRTDGRVLGFTDHDLDIVFEGAAFEGVVFKASTGLDASAVQSMNGLSVDNGQVVGALNDQAISAQDIRAGKFDGAEVYQWLVDWEQPRLRVLMFRGTFGEIRRADGQFEVELRGLAEALNVKVGRHLMRTCDCVLGDDRCRLDLDSPGFGIVAEVVEAGHGAKIVSDAVGAFPRGWFDNGRLEWLEGSQNAGESAVIRTETRINGRPALGLWQAPSLPVAAGDRFRATAGCDKRAETCRTKFKNFLNFRGFPHIPGEDWVTAYPKDGAVHDGGSQQ